MIVRQARNNWNLETVGAIFRWLVMAVTIVWILFPIWWAATFSFKGNADFFGSKIIPFVQFRPT